MQKIANSNKKYLKKLLFFLSIYTLLVFFHARLLSFLYQDEYEIFNQHSFLLLYPLFLIFSYLKWSRIRDFRWETGRKRELLLFLLLSVLFLLVPPQKLVKLNVDPSVASLAPFYMGVAFLIASVFGRKFVKKFGAEFLMMSYLLFAYIISKIFINYSWNYLVFGILSVFSWVFPLISDNYLIELDRYNVRLEDFSVYVGPTCAGIYSLVTFALLFIASAILLNRKSAEFNYKKAFFYFVTGLLGVYLLNILRVFIIVLVGAYISETLAIDLFHEYLGAIFLIGLFLIYLYFVIPKLSVPTDSSHKS